MTEEQQFAELIAVCAQARQVWHTDETIRLVQDEFSYCVMQMRQKNSVYRMEQTMSELEMFVIFSGIFMKAGELLEQIH